VVQDRDLERLLRPEVGEEAALRELQRLGQPADGEPLQPHLAREPERVVEDGLAGIGTLRHDRKIERPFGQGKSRTG
jgi:hypothetical protein